MYAVRVIPIQKGLFQDHLTFFSREQVDPGSLVSVEVRKRPISAVVVTCNDVREEKLNIKSADFSLKKITGKGRKIFNAAFIESVSEIANFHASHEGATLSQLTFSAVVSNPKMIVPAKERTTSSVGVSPEVLVLQAEQQERYSLYKNLTRECFAKGSSLLILAPSLIEVEQLAIALGKGIEERLIQLSGDMSPKRLRDQWNTASESTTPLLVIGTPAALSLPLPNLDTIVVEHETARSYKGRERPHIDMRHAAEVVAKRSGARCVLADFPVRVETRFAVESHHAEDLTRPQMRSMSSATVTILDVRKTDSMKKEKRAFTPLSTTSIESITAGLTNNGKVVVFAARKGIAPLTVCNDCGTPVTDPSTGTPMALHRTPKGNMFISHRSGAELPANTACSVCKGWNLVTLGIGIDRVYDFLVQQFPHTQTILFTKDTTPTHRNAVKLIQNFYVDEPRILLGTERMLPYLYEPVSTTVVASIDSMLSRPEWRSHEYALQILLSLRSKSQSSLIVETRKPDNDVMRATLSGNPMDFYRSEAESRSTYGYPPFVTFVGLDWAGPEKECSRIAVHVQNALLGLDVVGPLDPEYIDRTRLRQRAVIRVPQGEWPNPAVVEKIRTLPPEVSITIDPDEIV